MALLMNLGMNFGYCVCDVLNMLAGGVGPLSALIIVRYILTGIIACAATFLGVRIMRWLASGQGYALFGLYCFGMSLFMFILNLLA